MTNSYSTQGTPSIAQLTDTIISNPQNGDVLQYNSTTGVWNNGVLGSPYFLSIGFNDSTGTILFDENTNFFPDLSLNLTRFPNQSPQSDYVSSPDNSYWIPSQTGIYLLTCRAHLSEASTPTEGNIVTGQLTLYKGRKNSGTEDRFVIMTHAVGTDDDYINNSFLISTQIKVEDVSSTSGEKYRIGVRVDLKGTPTQGKLQKQDDYFGWEITKLG
jgi:hypothetical protein